jgi:hypothetical protein
MAAMSETFRMGVGVQWRRSAVTMTSSTATFLVAELLAGACNVRTLTGRTRRTTGFFTLPRNNTVQNVGAWLDAEYGVIQVDVALSFGVEGLNLELHGLALLLFFAGVCSRRFNSSGFDSRRSFGGGRLGFDSGGICNFDFGCDHDVFNHRGFIVILQRAGEWSSFRCWNLHSITNEQPTIFCARDRALYEDQAARNICANDFEILLRTLTVAHVAGHLLILENLARILALTSRTMGTVGNRHTMRCAHTTEAPTLHGTGKAFTLRVTGDVNELAINKVIG